MMIATFCIVEVLGENTIFGTVIVSSARVDPLLPLHTLGSLCINTTTPYCMIRPHQKILRREKETVH